FGGGKAGGAALEVEQMRMAVNQHPDRACVSLDLTNAVGTVQWADALQATLRQVRQLAPALAAQWAPGYITLFIQQADATWAECRVYGGVFQGGCDGHPCFLRRFSSSLG
ncbi:MAG: hypothetical protein ACKPKO_19315, partial [Candidatus Fonsibacter sp.]